MKHRKPTPAWQKLGLRVSKKLAVGATALATVFGRDDMDFLGSHYLIRTLLRAAETALHDSSLY